jgi:hypothetical protein
MARSHMPIKPLKEIQKLAEQLSNNQVKTVLRDNGVTLLLRICEFLGREESEINDFLESPASTSSDKVAAAIIEKAKKGDFFCTQLLVDRLLGKQKAAEEQTNTGTTLEEFLRQRSTQVEEQRKLGHDAGDASVN